MRGVQPTDFYLFQQAVQNAMSGLESPNASSAPIPDYAPPSYASATQAAFTPPTFDNIIVGSGFR